MIMWICLALITLLSLIYLFSGRPAPSIAREAEARRLVAQYQDNRAQLKEAPLQQEADYRLYQELSALLASKTQASQNRSIAMMYLLIPAAFCSAIMLWYGASGGEMQRWQRLYQAVDSDIAQHKIYGKSFLSQADSLKNINQAVKNAQFFAADGRKHTPLLVYCQALQRRLERSDPIQLEALGDCYSQLGLFELALPAYERLELLQPNETKYILAWAQAKTLANPEQPPAPEVISKLQRLLAAEPNNPLALLFLASAYQQHGTMDKALPLWQQLLSQLPPTDPLYPAVKQAADKAAASGGKAVNETITSGETAVENTAQVASEAVNEAVETQYHIQVSIAEQLLAQLPDSAKLFVMIAPSGEKMPIAVKMLKPQAQQQLILGDADSMAGASLKDYPQLSIRALLSPSGTVGDSQALKTEITPHSGETAVQLEFRAP